MGFAIQIMQQLTFGSRKVNDIAIALEHVDLLDCLDWLYVQLLERCLQLPVICACTLVHLLNLPPWCALASIIPEPSVFIAYKSEIGRV